MLNVERSEHDGHVLESSLGSSPVLWPRGIRVVGRAAAVALLVAGFTYAVYLLYAFLRAEFMEMLQTYVFSKIGSRWPR
jgi:hypothetical protein